MQNARTWPIVPTFTHSLWTMGTQHSPGIDLLSHKLAKLVIIVSALRKCSKLLKWYHNIDLRTSLVLRTSETMAPVRVRGHHNIFLSLLQRVVVGSECLTLWFSLTTSEGGGQLWTRATMISVVCSRTLLEMFCAVKPHFAAFFTIF